MKKFDEQFKVNDKDYTVYYLEKREEGILLMDVQYTPKQGKKREPVPSKEQQPIALLAKEKYEETNGAVTQFHYDNMAGGLAPRTPVTEQIWRPLRDERTGALMQPGNAKPGQTEMLSHGMWVATIDREYQDLWRAPGDGVQSWEKDPAMFQKGNGEVDALKQQLAELQRKLSALGV